jgi:hypothetical protein
MNDTQLINFMLGELGLETRDDLFEWVGEFSEGYECDHYYGFTYDEESGTYHITTEEELAERKRLANEHRIRMQALIDAGDTSLPVLMHKITQNYYQHMADAVFTSKPLLYKLL